MFGVGRGSANPLLENLELKNIKSKINDFKSKKQKNVVNKQLQFFDRSKLSDTLATF